MSPKDTPFVCITRTGKKYHIYDCEFLRRYNVKDKFAIYLDKAQRDYGPCGFVIRGDELCFGKLEEVS